MSTRPCARSAPPCSRPTSTSRWPVRSSPGVRARLVGEDLSQEPQPGPAGGEGRPRGAHRGARGETLRITYASAPPTVVLLAGLQGSGKTTASAKLARWFRQQGRNPLLVGADLQRPAAVEQLRILGEQAGVPVFSEPTDPVAVAEGGLREARRLGRDVLIVDTAGRLAIDEALMDEVRRVWRGRTPLHVPGDRRHDGAGRRGHGAGLPRRRSSSTASSSPSSTVMRAVAPH